MKIFFAWYDFWVGAYLDRERQTLYICPLPMVVIQIQYVSIYCWLTWATVREACSDEPIPLYKRVARKWLPEPKPLAGGN